QDAAALYNAAELALFDHGNQNTLIIPRDAGSDEASANAAARALYAAEKFEPIAERRRYYKNGGDALVMRLDL
ncbi:MAG TPA: hypothetical protein PKH09_07165, partial [Parvularculaceae bacterium]|nr:hypothetical protein [Parvularculaceae bacterium]